MQYKTRHYLKKEWLPFLLVAWLVVCSGSQHFRIYNSFFSNMLLLILAIFYFVRERQITRSNFIRLCAIGLLMGASIWTGVCVRNFRFNLNDAMIFCISCVVLVILQSNMTAMEFKRKYVYFMVAECCLSLVCFMLVTYFNVSTLPGYYEKTVWYSERGYNTVYLTPYYTMGWLSTHGFFTRNAGMFWEPGAHAVYLNIAILFIFSGALNGMKSKSRNILLGILLLGSLSTMSTTGYLTLAVSFGFLIFRDPKKWNTRKNITIIIAVMAAVLGIALFGSVFDKLIYRNGSFGTRLNDTVSGILVALQNWFMGKGMFVDIADNLSEFGIKNMSNGMIGLLIRIGFPMMVVYIGTLCRGIKRLLQVSGIALFCAEIFFLMFMCSESLCTYPIFISLVFFWRNKNNVELKEETTKSRCTEKNIYLSGM